MRFVASSRACLLRVDAPRAREPPYIPHRRSTPRLLPLRKCRSRAPAQQECSACRRPGANISSDAINILHYDEASGDVWRSQWEAGRPSPLIFHATGTAGVRHAVRPPHVGAKTGSALARVRGDAAPARCAEAAADAHSTAAGPRPRRHCSRCRRRTSMRAVRICRRRRSGTLWPRSGTRLRKRRERRLAAVSRQRVAHKKAR